MSRPVSYELWTDVVGAATPGTRLGHWTRVVRDPGPVDAAHIKRHEWTFEMEVAASDPLYQAHAGSLEEKVVRVQHSATASDFDEWRVRAVTDRIGQRGTKVVRLECVAPIYDLDRSGFIEFVAADGAAMTHFPAGERTPTKLLQIALGITGAPYVTSAPAHFKIGTVDPTDPLPAFVFQQDTAYTTVLEAAKLTGTEFWWDRDPADDQYRVHLLDRIGSGATQVPLRLKKNVLEFEHVSSSERQATRVTPLGGSVGGERATLANNAFTIQSVATDTLTMVDDVAIENGQLDGMGLYAEKPGGTLVQIVGTTAPNTIVLAAGGGSGLSGNDVIRLRRNAAGDDMTWVSSPAAEANLANAPIAGFIERPDIPPIDNEVTNGFLKSWSGGLPVGFGSIGTATLTETVDDLHSMYGGTSARVVAPVVGDGIAAVSVSVSPNDRRPHFTPQVWLEVVKGRVEIRLVDNTTGRTYPEPQATERAQSPGLGWQGIGFQHAQNHATNDETPALPTTSIDIEVVATEPDTEFYLDAVMLTNTFSGIEFDAFLEGRGSNLLYLAALDELSIRKDPLSTYAGVFADLNRLDAVTYPSTPFAMGADARIAEALPAEATTRILGRRRFLEHPARSELELETEEERLTRIVAARRHFPRQPDVSDHLKPPACGLNFQATHLGQDLVATWDRGNWARVEVRDTTGTTGSPKARFDAGTRLLLDDVTALILPGSGTGSPVAGHPDPSLIDELIIEAYNRWGKPGRCYEVAKVGRLRLPGACVNLIADSSAAQTFCSPGTSSGTPPVVLRSPPLVVALADLGNRVQAGVTQLTVCHEGASGKAGAVALSGFAHVLKSFISGFTHYRLERIDSDVASNPYSHANNTGGSNAAKKWIGTSVEDNGSDHTVRILWEDPAGTTARPDVQTSDLCCREITTDFYGERFMPSIIAGGTAGPSRVFYSHAYKAPYVECENMTGQRMRLERAPGFRYLNSAGLQDSTLQSGTGKLRLAAFNDSGGGRWDAFVLRDGSDVELARFPGSDHPSGHCWPGDRYTYDAGAGLAVGVGGVVAVNAAATLGLLESGFVYATDWEQPGAALDPAEWLIRGSPAVQNGRLEIDSGDSVTRSDVGDHPELVHEVVAQVPSTSHPDVLAAVTFGTPDIRAALRLTFDDSPATVVQSAGVGDGVDAQNFQQERAWSGVWPAGASQVTIEQLQVGTSVGVACSRKVEMVEGASCCASTVPVPIPGLPPIVIDCLLSASMKFWQLDDCAGGTGVGIAVSGFIQQTSNCPNLDVPGAFRFDAWYYEEYDPVGQPGDFIVVRQDRDVQPIPPLNPSGPTGFGWATVITDEDPLGLNPTPGTPRGSDGGSPVERRWYVRVLLVDQFGSGTAHVDTTQVLSPPYGWCP